MFDYEWATVQHTSTAGSRRRSSCPTRSRRSAWTATARAARCARYPGPEGGVLPGGLRARPGACSPSSGLDAGAADRGRPHAARPSRSTTASRTRCSPSARPAARRAGGRPAAHRAGSARSSRRDFIVPEHAIDAPSLIALADLVVSAGGTMNREAVALGTPVWTTFEGRLGAVDERLIAEGRMPDRLTDARSCRWGSAQPPRATACAATPGCWSSCCSPPPGSERQPRRRCTANEASIAEAALVSSETLEVVGDRWTRSAARHGPGSTRYSDRRRA